MFARLPAPGFLIVLCVLSAAGCGAGPATVSGTVTCDGKEVTGGSVILYCPDGQIVRGLIGSGGRYTIPNVPRGPAVVTVQTHPRIPDGLRLSQNLPPSQGAPIPPAGGPTGRDRATLIPGRYAIPEESGLSVLVDRDMVEYDLVLQR